MTVLEFPPAPAPPPWYASMLVGTPIGTACGDMPAAQLQQWWDLMDRGLPLHRQPVLAGVLFREAEGWSKRARAVGIKADRWPYGPNIDLLSRFQLVLWAERHQLVYDSTPGRSCPHWVAGQSQYHGCDLAPEMGWLDHGSRWRRANLGATAPKSNRVLVSQPYHITEREWSEIVALRDALGLAVTLEHGWYAADVPCIRWERAVA
jgi:hypothetical protein